MQNFNPFNETHNGSFDPRFSSENNKPNDNGVFFGEEEVEPVFGEDIVAQGEPGIGTQQFRGYRYPPYRPYPPYPQYPPYRPNNRRRARRLRRCVIDCERYFPQYPDRYIRCINNCCRRPYDY